MSSALGSPLVRSQDAQTGLSPSACLRFRREMRDLPRVPLRTNRRLASAPRLACWRNDEGVLARLIRKSRSGLVLNERFEQGGRLVFEHASLLTQLGHRFEAQALALRLGSPGGEVRGRRGLGQA